MDDDVWEDQDFLQDLLNAEKNVICSINPSAPSHHHTSSSNFSPPRELFSLSQNPTQPPLRPSNGAAPTKIEPPSSHLQPPPSFFTKSATATTTTAALYSTKTSTQQRQQDTEVDRLKRGLQSLSEDLMKLEKQRQELLKKKARIEEQLGVVHNPNSAHVKQETVLQDQLKISPQFQNASTSVPKNGLEYPVFEGNDNCSNVLDRLERPSEQEPYGSYGLNGKNMQVDGISATTDLKRCNLIDSALTTSNDCHVQKIVLPETTVQSTCMKAIGVQTDADEVCGYSSANNNLHSRRDLLNQFSAIWGLTGAQRAGKSLASKLFLTCSADIYALVRYLGMNMRPSLDSSAKLRTPDVVSQDKLQHFESAEAAKVAHLYSILTKSNSEMIQFDVLIDALLDLCTLKNLVVVHRSLCIVHVVLQHVMDWDERPNRRDNVVIEAMDSKNKNVAVCKSGESHAGIQFGVTRNGTSFIGSDSSGAKSFDLDFFFNERRGGPGNVAFKSTLDWLLLFDTMHRVALDNKEECIQVEAISVMNLILMRSNPFFEREKFGSKLLFESLSRLLRKDVGLQVQKQAVHLLFQLLNCPKILVLFCSGCKDDASSRAAADSTKDAPAFQEFNSILEGLAECVKSKGQNLQDVNLRRLSIKVLSFIASSGKSGFEVFLNQKVSKGLNFLELIMQTLSSEMDAEAVESTEPSETCKERISLIREALILMNRLASSPAYSAAVLKLLASSRDTVSLTIDVVNGMSRKGMEMQKFNSSTKNRKAEDEIVDLARVFKSRVFGYLGNPSSCGH